MLYINRLRIPFGAYYESMTFGVSLREFEEYDLEED